LGGEEDMTEAKLSKTPEKMVMIPEQDLADLRAFLGKTSLDNLQGIMSSLGEKKPSHTVLDTLVSIVLASTFDPKKNGEIYIGTMILPNQQTQEQELFVDVIAGFIGNQLSDKLQEKKEGKAPEDPTAMFEARQAFVQDPEVIGLATLLKDLEVYVSQTGIVALNTALGDFKKIEQFVAKQMEEQLDVENT
jgi:hypothetical protein